MTVSIQCRFWGDIAGMVEYRASYMPIIAFHSPGLCHAFLLFPPGNWTTSWPRIVLFRPRIQLRGDAGRR
jgi:hypothetical protein